MALTSASTLKDALDQYKNNLLWEGDVTKASSALEAVRYILACRPQTLGEGDTRVDFESLAVEKAKLETFVGVASSTAQRTTFTRGRMLY